MVGAKKCIDTICQKSSILSSNKIWTKIYQQQSNSLKVNFALGEWNLDLQTEYLGIRYFLTKYQNVMVVPNLKT